MIHVGTKVMVVHGSGVHSGKIGRIVRTSEVVTDGRGVPELPGHFAPVDWSKESPVRLGPKHGNELITVAEGQRTRELRLGEGVLSGADHWVRDLVGIDGSTIEAS